MDEFLFIWLRIRFIIILILNKHENNIQFVPNGYLLQYKINVNIIFQRAEKEERCAKMVKAR